MKIIKYSQVFTLNTHIQTNHLFKKLKIKIKPEIISIKKNIKNIGQIKKNYIEPKELQKILDDGKEIYLLDTRNNYEINIGTFKNAKNLNILKFEDFANKSDELKNINGKLLCFVLAVFDVKKHKVI